MRFFVASHPGVVLPSELHLEEGVMKKIILGVLLGSGCALAMWAASHSAWAGAKNPYTVYINTTEGYANGTLAGTYRSSNTVEYIGCWTERINSITHGYCYARNSANIYRTCQTTNADMLATMRAVNSTSYIDFGWGTGTSCSWVYVHNQSNHM
jgi:hypothetical protein